MTPEDTIEVGFCMDCHPKRDPVVLIGELIKYANDRDLIPIGVRTSVPIEWVENGVTKTDKNSHGSIIVVKFSLRLQRI